MYLFGLKSVDQENASSIAQYLIYCLLLAKTIVITLISAETADYFCGGG